MTTREKDIAKVKALGHMETCKVFWFEEGGGEVHRIWDTLILFSIPQYGGEGSFEGVFSMAEIDKLVDLAHTWT